MISLFSFIKKHFNLLPVRNKSPPSEIMVSLGFRIPSSVAAAFPASFFTNLFRGSMPSNIDCSFAVTL